MDNIKASGGVQLKVIDAKTGNILHEFEEKNKVVNGGIQNVARLLGGATAGKPITKVGFGESSNPVDISDSTLLNPYMKNIDSVVYPALNKVQFNFSLAANEANGMNITELSLFNTDNVMFSRKTRSAIAKTNAVIITGIWTITIN